MKKLNKVLLIFLIIIVLCIIGLLIYLYIFQEDKIAVLTYHDIVEKIDSPNSVNISVKKFKEQIKWLHDNNYRTLSLKEFNDWKNNKKKLPRKSVLITFDDGWKSFYNVAVPLLDEYKMKGNVFVIWKYTENCSKNNENTFINFDDIKDIRTNHKNMTVASHSYDMHRKDKALSKNYDIYNEDMAIVANVSESENKYYAYPFGNRDSEYIRALEDNNYQIAFTFGPHDFARKSDDNYEIPRLGMFESTQNWKFKLKMFLEK